ncbi:DUF898 family protein [Methylosinus sp. Sm6]|uniref:DUF898 family protein n=1 Tax=Methylosinus sp. Sm6 TaxID=2866948 RepID=UPI001C99618C|nr:DUF898 family protein [Methylosinus sp. Sm6]MBY6241362.1 DUF898 domain-containing protein [Methylosinus sp. Sm6]
MSDCSNVVRDEAVAASAPLPTAPRPILFTGENGEFRRLVMRGALLEIVTAGFYRFWLATKMRRYLWSNTVIDGDALEYVGAARELLFGFFFALAIATPAYLLYFLVTMEAERYKAFASLPLLLFFFAFGQYANYGARRYRLHKTSWRGLRFGMGGSGLAYLGRALCWGAVIALTLGLALPFAQAALERYKMRNTSYGGLRGDFVARGGAFFKRGWWIWAATIAVAVTSLILGAAKSEALLLLAMLIALFAAPALYAAFKAAQWRWWLEGLRLGDIRLETSLTTRRLLTNYYVYFAIVMGCMLAFGALVGIVTFVLISGGHAPQPQQQPSAALFVLFGAFYVLTFVAAGIATRIYFVQRVWKIVAGSLRVHALEQAEAAVAETGSSANAINEGFLGSLDVVGF